VGIGIKKGAPRPDIRTPGAFKRTLLAAKSITWAKEGQSGIYFASLLERIGIAEQMKPKSRPRLHRRRSRQTRRRRASPARRHPRQRTDGRPRRRSPGTAARRTAELHRLPCRRRRGLEGLVGGKALIKFLTTPAAGAVFKKKGQEPG